MISMMGKYKAGLYHLGKVVALIIISQDYWH